MATSGIKISNLTCSNVISANDLVPLVHEGTTYHTSASSFLTSQIVNLDTVTTRGNTTTNSISVNNLSATDININSAIANQIRTNQINLSSGGAGCAEIRTSNIPYIDQFTPESDMCIYIEDGNSPNNTIFIKSSDDSAVGGKGGCINITGGSAPQANTSGGIINITAGSAGGASNGIGGDVCINPGDGGIVSGARDGRIMLGGSLSAHGPLSGDMTLFNDLSVCGDMHLKQDAHLDRHLFVCDNAYLSGEVGIKGDTTVYGSLSVCGDLYTTLSVTTSSISVISYDGDPPLVLRQYYNPGEIAHFIDVYGDDIVFDAEGRIGVNTATPNEKITVVGNISATGNVVAGSGILANNLLVDSLTSTGPIFGAITPSSNVGIGTCHPNQKLTVVGNISATDTTFTNDLSTNRNAFIAGSTCVNDLSAFGKIIGGSSTNLANGVGSTILGGTGNLANSVNSSIVGGDTNQATGNCSFIGGGDNNISNGNNSNIAGGKCNQASGNYSTVAGGFSGRATATNSFVGGGICNIANAVNSNVVGGKLNQATGEFSFVGGGYDNIASGNHSNVVGGLSGLASSKNSFVGGGSNNIASGDSSSVVGGLSGRATGKNSFVGGGSKNVASGNYSNVVGGLSSTAGGKMSFVGGGSKHVAGGDYSSVIAGLSSKATGKNSFIGGGTCNIAGINSNVVGGQLNQATGEFSFVGGGKCNIASSFNSGILGGTSNTVTHVNSFIIGNGLSSGGWNTTFVNNLSSPGSLKSSQLIVCSVEPTICLVDTNNDSDFSIRNDDGTFRIYDTTISKTRVEIPSNGYVGLGRTPVKLLDIKGGDFRITSDCPSIFLNDTDNDSDFGIQNNNGSFEILDTTNNSKSRLAIDSDGKVGIGTTTPNENLTVVGNISATGNMTSCGSLLINGDIQSAEGDLVIQGAGGGAPTFCVDQVFDRVGINIAVAEDGPALTVSGNISASGNLSASNIDIAPNGLITVGTQGTGMIIDNVGISYQCTDNIVFDLESKMLLDGTDGGEAISFTDHNKVAICNNLTIGAMDPTKKLGINTNFPNEALTIVGNISATGSTFTSGCANIDGAINFGDRTSNDILIRAESDGNDLTLFRAAGFSDNVGVDVKYLGSGGGDENIFEIATDGGGSFKMDQSGDIGINTAPTDGVDLTTAKSCITTGLTSNDISLISTTGDRTIKVNNSSTGDGGDLNLLAASSLGGDGYGGDVCILAGGGHDNGQNGHIIIESGTGASEPPGDLEFKVGTTQALNLTFSESVFNEGSTDLDLRVESNNNTSMLHVDAANDKVGIGTATPNETLTVAGNVSATGEARIDNCLFVCGGQVDNHTLSVGRVSCKVGINASIPRHTLHITETDGGNIVTPFKITNDSNVTGTGTAIAFGTNDNSGTSGFQADIQVQRVCTSAISDMVFRNRATNSDAVTEKMRIHSDDGQVTVSNALSAGTLSAANGFTGTGAFSTFTIQDGIIIAAS